MKKRNTINEENYVFSTEIKVRDYELDIEGIVNNANYIHYLEISRHEFCEYAGYSFVEMTADGVMPVVRRIEIEYVNSLRGGDVAISKLWVERKGPRFIFHQDLFSKQTGELAATALVNIVCVENGKLSRGEIMANAFAKWL